MRILKFGGTSVGSAERMQALTSLIQSDAPRIVVLSAMSGTTNALVQITESLYQHNHQDANAQIDALQSKYKQVVAQLYTSAEKKTQANELLDQHFDYIRAFTQDLFTEHEERAILAQGELLSTALFQFYLEEQGINSCVTAGS